jgi:hypothetical protein
VILLLYRHISDDDLETKAAPNLGPHI